LIIPEFTAQKINQKINTIEAENTGAFGIIVSSPKFKIIIAKVINEKAIKLKYI
jgi:hypothetical protein